MTRNRKARESREAVHSTSILRVASEAMLLAQRESQRTILSLAVPRPKDFLATSDLRIQTLNRFTNG
jgi:hypothetical protein